MSLQKSLIYLVPIHASQLIFNDLKEMILEERTENPQIYYMMLSLKSRQAEVYDRRKLLKLLRINVVIFFHLLFLIIK